MFARLISLHDRYAAANLVLRARTAPILDREGRQVGYVDQAILAGGRLRVSGWVGGVARVSLRHGTAESGMAPCLYRGDLASVPGAAADTGFDLTLPCTQRMLADSALPRLEFTPADGAPAPQAMALVFPARRRERLWFFGRFATALLASMPSIAGWMLWRDPQYRARVKRNFGLQQLAASGLLETRLFGQDTGIAGARRDPRVTIVLPVYNAFDLLGEVLDRVVSHTDLPWHLILIEDASSDDRVRPFLRHWVARQQRNPQGLLPGTVALTENPANLGFIGSVNAGLAAALAQKPPADGTPEGPVVLLNSDAFVPAGWASRLIRPLLADAGRASATPMSNDAEILSVPAICARSDLAAGQGDAIDGTARRFHPDAVLCEVPTGVGFCMAIARDWLARVPALDPVFGRGYGEEVDWCQKVRALGGTHVAVPGLFVEHRGGSSFGTADKRAMIAANGAIISRRYPAFDREVQDFVAADPALTARLALGLAWAGSRASPQPVPIYLAHSLGGGAEIYLRQRIAEDIARDGTAVVLRVGGPRRWRVELYGGAGCISGETGDTGLVHQLLDALPHRRIVYSCGVGDQDPSTLPGLLTALRQRDGDRIEVLFHDYFPISPAYTLLDSDGVYRGPVTRERADPAHRTRDAAGRQVSLADWQAAWRELIAGADELQVFSEASAAEVCAVWPEFSDRIVLRPHRMTKVPPRLLPRPAGPRPVLGVLGNINLAKGAGVVQAIGEILAGQGDRAEADLVLIGNIDPAYPLPAPAQVHGAYDPADIALLAERYRVSHWLIPSVWPETFSFTTHEALATGLPVLTFAIGAQGAAAAAAGNGVPIPLAAGGAPAESVLAALRNLSAPASEGAGRSSTRRHGVTAE